METIVIYGDAIRNLNSFFKESNKRIHMSRKTISIDTFNNIDQLKDTKPKGLWFATGNAWIHWCLDEQPDWVDPNIYEIEVNEDKILKISNIDEFDKFEKEYCVTSKLYSMLTSCLGDNLTPQILQILNKNQRDIDFNKVSQYFGGIEISPYFHEKRFDSYWYYGWDCASGCIWNKSAIKDIKLIAQYNPEKKDYDFFGER